MIKSYKLYNEVGHISKICKLYGIRMWSVNDDGLVDVDGDVDLSSNGLDKIPLNFGKVNGNFSCYSNHLKTLEGCPKEVTGNFFCNDNYLTSLEGCPQIIDGQFDCNENRLTSLIGCPQKVRRFNCSDNNLKSLIGCPKLVTENFYCNENDLLISLEGLVNAGDFYCDHECLNIIGKTMISKKISFPEAVVLHMDILSDSELIIISQTMEPQTILDLSNFKIFNLLRMYSPQKYADIMSLRNVDLSADLGELGF